LHSESGAKEEKTVPTKKKELFKSKEVLKRDLEKSHIIFNNLFFFSFSRHLL